MATKQSENNNTYSLAETLNVDISQSLCISAIVILAINYILYAFFKLEYNKTILRSACLVLFLASTLIIREVSIQELFLFFVCAFLLINNGNLAANIGYLMISSIALPRNAKMIWGKINRVQWILLGIVVLSLVTGRVQSIETSIGLRRRNSLGFININSSAIFFYSIISLFLYTKEDNKWYDYLFSLVASYYVYLLTNSRTSFVCILSMVFLMMILGKSNNVVSAHILCAFEVLFFIVPILIPTVYRVFPKLDVILSLRLSISMNYINSHSYLNLLFGGSTVREIDNSYLLLLYNGGMFIYLFTAYMSIVSTWEYIKMGDANSASFIFSILLMGLMESTILRCEVICSILFWYLILKRLKTEELIE